SKLRRQCHVATKAAHHGADMGKADAFARLGLRTRPPEQLEYALMVRVGNAPAIVLDLNDHAIAGHVPGTNGDPKRPRLVLILYGIVEHVAQNLLDGHLVGDKLADADVSRNLTLTLGHLMVDSGCARLDKFCKIHLLRVEPAATFAGYLENGVDQ